MHLLPYLRVSTDKQGESGLGLEAQRASIETECSRRHWQMPNVWHTEVASVSDERPVLARLLLEVRNEGVDGLIVAKLDRLGRSTHEVSGYIEQAVEQGWLLVCLTPVVDMTTPYGRAMAQMAVVFSELERAMIRERTAEALQAKIARGEWVGRRPEVGGAVEARVRGLHPQLSLRAICGVLDAEGFRTPNGGSWQPSTVQRIVRRLERDFELGRIREEGVA